MKNSFLSFKKDIDQAFNYHKKIVQNNNAQYQQALDGFNWCLNVALTSLSRDNATSSAEMSQINSYAKKLCDDFLKLQNT